MSNLEASVILSSCTADGFRVLLWSDGTITNSVGQGFTRHCLSYDAASKVLGEVVLATAEEVPKLIRAATRLPAGFCPGDLRAEAWGPPRPTTAQAEALVAANQQRRVRAAREHLVHCRSPWCRQCGF